MSASKISFWSPASLVSTVFGVGKIPFAPGTWGSLVGVLYFVYEIKAIDELGKALQYDFSYYLSIIDAVFGFLVGWWAAAIYDKKTKSHDSSEIVVDEVVGQFITCLIAFLAIGGQYPENQALFLLVCFATFRLFDIVKKGPVGWVDRNVKGGLGVMLDDIVAGVMAGITSTLIFYLIGII